MVFEGVVILNDGVVVKVHSRLYFSPNIKY